MSTKDNWDDSSEDEEEVDLLRLPPDPLYEAKEPEEGAYPPHEEAYEEAYQSDEEEFVDAKAFEEGDVGVSETEYPQEEYYSEQDDDYEDELDDYDKKLGRYVSCR